MARGIITLTTDFGISDHFVGVMKGVILGLCPRASIVAVTHMITPFEIREAAFVISQAYTRFPAGTVHVVVVDPGVGTSRRRSSWKPPPVLRAPDNGSVHDLTRRKQGAGKSRREVFPETG